MATQETKELDNIISSRRALILGGSALAALAMTPAIAKAANTATGATDADILNFALNLEYLEANFYYMAAFGTTIDNPTAASAALGGPTATIALNGVATNGNPAAGIRATVGTATNVPFTIPAIKAYAIETALEEGKHVSLLRSALGSAAVAQPPIDVSPAGAFTTLANNLTPAVASFNPYMSDATFLIGAYIFEDVGVTAYHGAASLITVPANLAAAASILAVEAYHAGLVRTSINIVDPSNASGLISLTQSISALRSKLSYQALTAPPATPDDYGLQGANISTLKRTFDNGTSGTATTIVVADANVKAFSRNTTQVLNIVTGGGALTSGAAAKGVFFPSAMNGLIS